MKNILVNTERVKEIKTLIEPNRLNILSILLNEDTCACKMVKVLNLKNNLLSHHLKTLSDMKYISHTRTGKHIIYAISSKKRSFVYDLLYLVNNKK